MTQFFKVQKGETIEKLKILSFSLSLWSNFSLDISLSFCHSKSVLLNLHPFCPSWHSMLLYLMTVSNTVKTSLYQYSMTQVKTEKSSLVTTSPVNKYVWTEEKGKFPKQHRKRLRPLSPCTKASCFEQPFKVLDIVSVTGCAWMDWSAKQMESLPEFPVLRTDEEKLLVIFPTHC